jgi:phosphoribosylformylglycinamidine cyclo-ligase
MTEKITYKDAGVDVELADRVIGSLGDRINATFTPGVEGRLGGFAALFRPEWRDYEDPLLVSATDGVGTKLKIAFLTGIHDTVGIDLVAMSVNDILVMGARPLFFLDYFATGAIEPETIRSVVSGIAAGCEQAGCALIGGETAEMPDFYGRGEYDLAGFCVGIAERAHIPDASRVKPGQVVIGLASSGLHSNGFSLVRKVLLEHKGYRLDQRLPDLGRTLGSELIEPTAIFVKPVLELTEKNPPPAMAHITGGGFKGNIPRVLPDDCSVRIDKRAWETPPVFEIIRRDAGLDDEEMFGTFNMGIGFVLIVPEDAADGTVKHFGDHGVKSFVIGEVRGRTRGEEPVVLA